MAKFVPNDTPPVPYRPPEINLVQEDVLWCDKKRPFLSLPLSFTKYILYADRLVIQTGFLIRQTEEVRLYRVLDTSFRQTLCQRLFRLGSVKLQTADAISPKIFIHDVRYSESVHRLISDLAEQQRQVNRIGMMECFNGF